MPIVIKTQMRRIPKNCRECPFYISSVYSQCGKARCRVKSGYIHGKLIGVYGGRPSWCPLRTTTEEGVRYGAQEKNAYHI